MHALSFGFCWILWFRRRLPAACWDAFFVLTLQGIAAAIGTSNFFHAFFFFFFVDFLVLCIFWIDMINASQSSSVCRALVFSIAHSCFCLFLSCLSLCTHHIVAQRVAQITCFSVCCFFVLSSSSVSRGIFSYTPEPQIASCSHFCPPTFSRVCSPHSKMGHFCPSSPLCLWHFQMRLSAPLKKRSILAPTPSSPSSADNDNWPSRMSRTMRGKNNMVRVFEKASHAKNTAYAHLWGFTHPFLLNIASRKRQCSAEKPAEGPKVGVQVFRVFWGVQVCLGCWRCSSVLVFWCFGLVVWVFWCLGVWGRSWSTSANFDFGPLFFSSSANSTSANFDFGQFNFGQTRPLFGCWIFRRWKWERKQCGSGNQ